MQNFQTLAWQKQVLLEIILMFLLKSWGLKDMLLLNILLQVTVIAPLMKFLFTIVFNLLLLDSGFYIKFFGLNALRDCFCCCHHLSCFTYSLTSYLYVACTIGNSESFPNPYRTDNGTSLPTKLFNSENILLKLHIS